MKKIIFLLMILVFSSCESERVVVLNLKDLLGIIFGGILMAVYASIHTWIALEKNKRKNKNINDED